MDSSGQATRASTGAGGGLIVKERPILFSAPMIHAILDGSKTMTRRIVRPQFSDDVGWAGFESQGYFPVDDDGNPLLKPRYSVGDHLYVRESFIVDSDGMHYAADGVDVEPTNPDNKKLNWEGRDGKHPSIHLPRWASRITLEITGVRVERLNDISPEDADAEGAPHAMDDKIERAGIMPAMNEMTRLDRLVGWRFAQVGGFAVLWESINGKGSWAANPWVWVISFKRLEKK